MEFFISDSAYVHDFHHDNGIWRSYTDKLDDVDFGE